MISGKMTVSWNLSLRGRMAAYSAEEGTIQAYGWGLSLNPSKDKEISKWIINLDSGKLNSNDALIVSAIQASATRQYNLNKFHIKKIQRNIYCRQFVNCKINGDYKECLGILLNSELNLLSIKNLIIFFTPVIILKKLLWFHQD